MRRERLLRSVAAVGCLAVLCSFSRAQDLTPKKRVTVLNFDNPDVGSDAPSGLFGPSGENVGKGFSVQLIQKLLDSGKYTIVDQLAVEQLLKEQKNADTERLDAYGLAARIGRLLGLDAMIVGAVTRYGPEAKSDAKKDPKEASGNVFGAKVHTRKSKAFVEIATQVFNITTGQVIAGFTATGESTQFGEIATISVRGHANASSEMLSSDFVDHLLGEATTIAVEKITMQLIAFADKIPTLHLQIDGLVAEVAGGTLTLNVGKKSGVKVGDRLEVLRDPPVTAELSDPKTVQPAAKIVGLATVIDVSEDYATATTSGEAPVQIGDRVRGVDILPASTL